VDPQCNIICFRHRPDGMDISQLNAHNERLRATLKQEGLIYIVKTSLRGAVYLRCTLTNPFTTEEHLQNMLNRLKAMALEQV